MNRFILMMMVMFSCSMGIFPVGELDTTFGTGGIVTTDVGSTTADIAYAVAIQPDGKSVVVGAAALGIGLVRYNIDGSIDTTFGTDGKAYPDFGVGTEVAYAVAIQRDGKIVVAGTHNNSGNFVAARYDADGSLDTSFGANGLATYVVGTSGAIARGIAIKNDGKIILAGNVDSNFAVVIRINQTDGSLDTTFNSSGTGGDAPNTAGIITTDFGTSTTIYGVVVQSDGKIVVAGKTGFNFVVARYVANGSGLDTAGFNNTGTPGYNLQNLNGMGDVYGIALQSDNKIVVVGYHYDGSTNSLAVARFTTAGLLDSYANNNVSPFGTGGAGFQTGYVFYGFAEFTSAIAQDIVVQSDNKIVVAGTYEDDFIVARFLSDGSALDTTFDTVGYVITDIGSSSVDEAHAIAMQENNKFIVVGTTDSNAGDFAVVRYNGDAVPQGAIDTTYDSDGFVTYPTDNDSTHKPQVKALQVQADNSVLVVTENLAVATKSQLVQLAADGTVLTTAIDIAQTGVSDVIMDGSGRVLVVGSNGSNGWIARYTITPGAPGTFSLDPNFNSGAILVETTNSTQVLKVAENSFGKIIVAAKNGSSLYLLSYNSDGSVDTSFGVGGTGYYLVSSSAAFHDMLIGPDNGIYVLYKDGVVKISKSSSDGTALAPGFNSGAVVSTGMGTYSAGCIALDRDGKLIFTIIKSAGYTIVCKRYQADGTLELTKDFGNPFVGVPVIKQSQCDTDNKTIFTGYDNDAFFVIRLEDNLTNFDESFAPNAQMPGFLKAMYNNNNPTNFVDGAVGTTPHRVSNTVSIGGNGNIIFGGYESIDANNTVSFVARVVGDATPYTQVDRYPGYTPPVPGELNRAFATSGVLDLGVLDASILNSQAQAVLPLADGGHYIAFNDGSSASQLIKITSENVLDVSYSSTGILDEAPQGVQSMIFDGLGRVVLTGTDGLGNGWVQRYALDYVIDGGFASNGLISGPMSVATTTIEQSLGRLVVAGKNTNGVLRAYTDAGVLDTTFNSLGSTPGEFSLSGNTNAIYALVADEYDRLIIAYLNAAGDAIDLARLTASGELDTTFGTAGVVAGVIANADDATQVRLVLNTAGNIVVAAHMNDGADKIAVKSYDNLLASSGNGAVVNAQYDISGLTGPTLTDVIATSDGHVLVLGTQSGTQSMWLARVILSGTSTIALDSAGFNPNAVGGTAGIFQYAGDGTTGHIYNAVAAHADDRLSVVGYENSGGTFSPYLVSVYNDTLVVQEEQFPSTEPIGTRDQTFGVTTDSDDRITFFASAGAGQAQEQVARAIALQGYNKLLVACDGQSTADTDSRVFLNQFTVEGVVDTTFNTTGQVEVPHVYAHEHVRDMIVFTQDGLNKAILAGYATSGSPLNTTNSWLMQYDLSTYGADPSFGGKYQDGSGTAFGDVQELHTVGRQSTGTIIASGLNYDSVGTIVGYGSNGLLDKSFGSDGYYFSASTTGIYTHVIDNLNRVVFAYTNGSGNLVIARLLADGSRLDATFGTAGLVTTAIAVAENDQTRVAIDQNGNIVVVTQVITSGDCSITRYTSAGVLDVTLTLPVATFGDTLTFNIARLLIDGQGKVIVLGTSLELGSEWMMVVRTTSDVTTLDTTFNVDDTPGYIKYQVDSLKTSRELIDGVIHPDGRVIAVGSEGGSLIN